MNASRCTYCNVPIASGCKYLVAFLDQPNGGIRIEVGCEHYTPPNIDKANWVAGGSDCAMRLLIEWQNELRCVR
jgi:hypothetical protein